MNKDGLAKLSDGQRACLRLVYMHKSSKDIARELSISPHTVDQRLKQAIQILQADNRFDAACFLAWNEGISGYQPLVYQRPDIADVASHHPHGSSFDQTGMHARSGLALREDQVAFEVTPPGTSSHQPLPPSGEKRSDLNVWQKLGYIIAIAVAAALSFGAILAGLDALARLT